LLYRSRLFNPRRAAGLDGAAVRVAGRRCSVAAARLPRSPSGHGAGGECCHGERLKLLDYGTRDGWPPDGKQRHMQVAFTCNVCGQRTPWPSIPMSILMEQCPFRYELCDFLRITQRTHTHPYKHAYANPTPMSISEGLSWQIMRFMKSPKTSRCRRRRRLSLKV
jgi:hypothetical protein